MGICLGWTQSRDIAPDAWSSICSDLRRLQPAFDAELARRSSVYRQAGFLFSAFATEPPVPAFQIRMITDEYIRVAPGQSKGLLGFIDSNSGDNDRWQLNRAAGENWFRVGGGRHAIHHGEALLAALVLVEHHAPGVIQINQDDFGPGCWDQVLEWVGPAIGANVSAPAVSTGKDHDIGSGRVSDPPARGPSP